MYSYNLVYLLFPPFWLRSLTFHLCSLHSWNHHRSTMLHQFLFVSSLPIVLLFICSMFQVLPIIKCIYHGTIKTGSTTSRLYKTMQHLTCSTNNINSEASWFPSKNNSTSLVTITIWRKTPSLKNFLIKLP